MSIELPSLAPVPDYDSWVSRIITDVRLYEAVDRPALEKLLASYIKSLFYAGQIDALMQMYRKGVRIIDDQQAQAHG